jgi:hypothetical protein
VNRRLALPWLRYWPDWRSGILVLSRFDRTANLSIANRGQNMRLDLPIEQ